MWVVALAPLVPLLLVTLRFWAGKPLNRSITVFLSVIAAVFGGLIVLLGAAVGTTGTTIAMMHGFALTTAISATILLLSINDVGNGFSLTIKGLLIFPLLVSIWSVTNIFAVILGANQLSQGRAFCIATHSPTEPIRALEQLRGLSFYTTASGFKDNSGWYFHGLLLLDNDGPDQVFNWSPRRLRFDQVEDPEKMIIRPTNACKPRNNFWGSLSIL